MRKLFALAVFLLVFCSQLAAQELQCNVVVNLGPKVQLPDRSIITDMQNAIFQFMNTRQWTNDIYRPEERIEANMYITITEIPQIGVFKAKVQVQSSRPVFGTGYATPVFSFVDQDWTFDYAPSQPMNFSINSFSSNLTSMLAYYAYTIIGFDYDTFSKNGGSEYFTLAQTVASAAQGDNSYAGWDPMDDKRRNRYWLNDNLLDPQVLPLREGLYTYHRLALDNFAAKPDDARTQVLEVLKGLRKVQQAKPGTVLLRSFFDAKSDEIASIFSQGNPQVRAQAYNILQEIDPVNLTKYEAMVRAK